jgi:hypothetical protein
VKKIMKKLTKLTITLAIALGLLVLPAVGDKVEVETATVSVVADPGGGTP